MFTGLFYRDQIAAYYRDNGLPEPYESTARRKIVPETLEQRVLAAFAGLASLFRKTSCAVSYAHGLPDYNGHYGIRNSPTSARGPGQPVPQHAPGTFDQPDPPGCPRPAKDTAGMQVAGISDRAAIVSAWPMSSPATTCSMRSAFRYTMSATRITCTGTAARISDGGTTPHDD